jgi:hypothetical protein
MIAFFPSGPRWRNRGQSVPTFRIVAPLVLLALHSVAQAEEFEQHHAHEHGKVTLNAALEGASLIIMLESPAANVVGFEHAPRTDAERSAVAKAAAFLRGGTGLFALPADAQCRFEKTNLTEPAWEKGHDSQEDHEHDHEHEEEHEGHTDYEARFTYRCAQAAKLAWLEPSLLGQMSGVTEARVNLVTPSGQRSEVVKSPRARVSLRGS